MKVVLAHEQIVREQVNVTASAPGIDVEQISDQSDDEYAGDREYSLSDLARHSQSAAVQSGRGAGCDWTGACGWIGDMGDAGHAGWIRYSLAGERGSLSLRVSADAVRSIDTETTRYPVEFGRSTGGVIAFYTGMGDDKFRFNATNFVPSFRDLNGIRFDKFVPRFTFSGPMKRGHAWWYDGAEVEYDNIYISELPANADTDELIRGSNLMKVQDNLTATNIRDGGTAL